jgi:hypothetical protein
MLSGITRARVTFCYFPDPLKNAHDAAEWFSAENALVASSNTTAAPHELFDSTGTEVTFSGTMRQNQCLIMQLRHLLD